MSSLKGKVAMVTGAASKRGMGHAIALRMAKEGADVIVTDKFAAPKSMFPGMKTGAASMKSLRKSRSSVKEAWR